MKLRALLALLAVAVLAMAVAIPMNADAREENPPKKIAICHFSGHTADAPFSTGCCGITDSDFVITYPPSPTFCESKGGKMIWLSEKGAINGHKVHPGSHDRIDAYPER